MAALPAPDTDTATAAAAVSSRSSSRSSTTTTTSSDKRQAVRAACASANIAALAALASSPGGLVADDLRATAWPLLLGVAAADHDDYHDWAARPPHRDEAQVALDVDRAFVYYPPDPGGKQLAALKHDLSAVITAVLRRHPALCYFQGYHDIAQVFLLVLGRQRAPPAVARLSLLRVRDFMLPSMSAAIVHLRLLPPLLRAVDARLEQHLALTQPFFALAATLTLYAHDIQEYGDIARLFDFLLAHDAAVPLYLFAAIVLSRKPELLDIAPDEPEMLHSVLSKLPKPLDLEALLATTLDLYRRHPPHSLPGRAWARVSSSSVLKTTRDPAALRAQTLDDGQRFFDRQAQQIRTQQALARARALAWRSRRPAAALVGALGVTLLAYWLRRDPSALAAARALLHSWLA